MNNLKHTPLANTDSYKLSHALQYPEKTQYVYSNFTPRRSRIPGQDRVVLFGLQAAVAKMVEDFDTNFFKLGKSEAVSNFVNFYNTFLGTKECPLVDLIAKLHDYGRLPLSIAGLREGLSVTHGVPMFVMFNTNEGFYWLTNYLETYISSQVWHPCTSATTSMYYHKLLQKYYDKTGSSELGFIVDFQAHDFSFRGQTSLESAAASGAAHAIFSKGSDTCPALMFLSKYYRYDADTLVITSVPATEHSVMCAGMNYDGDEASDFDILKRVIFDVHPTGIVSVVSDSFDFWRLVTEYLPELKDRIMARDGKVVIRPDSSPKTPVEILVGDPEAQPGSAEFKGLIECLWDTFGGKVNDKGYKELDSHIGAIYGDSITLEYLEQILAGLEAKGFASTNIVLGVGSFTYQYCTRDTHGFAMKATYVQIDGKGKEIFKDPKTDNSGKKSAKGMVFPTVHPTADDFHAMVFDDIQNVYEVSVTSPYHRLYLNDGRITDEQNFDEVRVLGNFSLVLTEPNENIEVAE